MEPTEPRKQVVAAAVSQGEKKAIELAVEVDGLGSVSEALRANTVTALIARGEALIARLRDVA
jgi:hypothetical protein